MKGFRRIQDFKEGLQKFLLPVTSFGAEAGLPGMERPLFRIRPTTSSACWEVEIYTNIKEDAAKMERFAEISGSMRQSKNEGGGEEWQKIKRSENIMKRGKAAEMKAIRKQRKKGDPK